MGMFPADNNSLPGVVLLAHGSSDPETGSELRELCGILGAARPGCRFEPAFLNQDPGLEQAVAMLVSEGRKSLRILPLLVFKGKHVLEDIPRRVEDLRTLHAGIELELEPHLSRLPGFGEMILRTLENI